MKLFVDDVRTPPEGWRLARTIEEAIDFLKSGGVEEMSLDYVIGYDDKNNFSSVARYVVDMPMAARPKRVYIHTSSSEGYRHLKSILDGAVLEIRRI